VRTAAAGRRKRAPYRTPRRPPGHGETLTRVLKRTPAMRSCRLPLRRGAPALGCYRIERSISDPEAPRTRRRDREVVAPDACSTLAPLHLFCSEPYRLAGCGSGHARS
jgi:hypothetical protein